jgi:hypothetical protein
MPRHRFRSQPALDRSGGRTPSAILGLCLVAGIALGGGALVSTLYRGFTQPSDEIQAIAPADEPARPGFARDAPPAEAPSIASPPASIEATPQPQPLPAPIVRVKAPLAARAARSSKPPNDPILKPATQQQQWERQRVDYERARDVYDANERTEGYRWAQRNKIKVPRFCRAAEQRTPAFMDGCLNYLRPTETKGPDKPRTLAPTE